MGPLSNNNRPNEDSENVESISDEHKIVNKIPTPIEYDFEAT